MALLLALSFGFFPMLINALWVYWLDRYEQEPKRLLGFVFLWGALIAAGGALVLNTLWQTGFYLLTSSESLSLLSTYILAAPLIEETLKGLAVLIVFLFYRHEFDSILDGIVYASVVALGFAATENALYIYERGYLAGGYEGLLFVTLVRVVLVGWQHPFYTSFLGIGLAISRLSHSTLWKATAPILGFFAAFLTHSLHNAIASINPSIQTCIIGTVIDWSGWIALFFFVIYTITRERRLLETHLRDEVTLGTITPAQYYRTLSFFYRTFDPLVSVFHGRYSLTRRFYQLCGELAHKKAQVSQLRENTQRWIEVYRAELSQVSRLLSNEKVVES